MGDVGLLLSGATLFLNSLMLLGKADGKSVGVFNLFIGVLQVVIPFYLIAVSDQQTWTIFNLACVFLFGFTYLYVGMTNVANLNGSGLGWFSVWVSVIAVVYAMVSAVKFHDTVSTLTWVMWAYLWFLFFLSMALHKKIDAYVGKVAFVQSWVTLTLPALLSLMGVWKTPLVSQVWTYVLLASFVYFIVCTVQLFVSSRSVKIETPVETRKLA
ncbi:AmiS/UreI family transporter [Priestia koreensis]|uniref:AmiS/UreI family transporter n=1 Tax=Priestia koreensis TaxID=284581 RepID=UPI001F58EB2C|nr:AmiS/UreI family transporter [Priestia koreensis]MCM3005978.1 AmiS/UreI family transporter [Priestia koreensis]UNL85319.1 AmiS/UreI family transporter [Priestia koreensis]